MVVIGQDAPGAAASMRSAGAYRVVMEPGPAQSDRRSTAWSLVTFVAALLVVGAACAPSNPEPSPSGGSSAVSSGTPPSSVSPTPTVIPAPTSTPAATSAALDRPLAGSGSIAAVRADGSLWLIDADGRSRIVAGADEGTFGFPTWSPDASQIAVIRTSVTETAILVFDVERATTGLPVVPRVIFRSATAGPFYLSWTPDSKEVSFLATDAAGLALRIAPADGTMPVDGSGPGAIIRAGNPFYYDWIDSDHLLAHIGSGAAAFLGEIGRDGASVAPAIKAPGTFRSADMSGDGKFMGFVRAGKGGKDSIVVVAPDGSHEQSMPVFGMAAVDFSPTDDTLASIGSIELADASFGLPVGPLRLIDAPSGATRTLLDGSVVSFAWSPDGTTIAAIRVAPAAGGSSASTASATASPAPNAGAEVRLVFVDVGSGKVLSQPRVAPGQRYVSALLAYFDQYALSHHLWAPDSSSILLPQGDPDGTTHVDVIFPNGDPPVSLDDEIGFWSP